MSVSIDFNSDCAQMMSDVSKITINGLENHWKKYKQIWVACFSSSLYAAIGFPFDVRMANRQIDKPVAIRDCLRSRGFSFCCSTAFLREAIGINITRNVRLAMKESIEENKWNENQYFYNFISGVPRAICDAFIGNPILIAKQMVFTQKASSGTLALKQRYEQANGEIVQAFYRKTFPFTLVRNCLSSGLYAMFYAQFSRKDESPLISMAKGGAINVSCGLITYPIDRIRNTIVHDKMLNFTRSVKKIVFTKGICGFYAGYSSAIGKMFASGVVNSIGMNFILRAEASKKSV